MKRRKDGRYQKVKKIKGKSVTFYSRAKTKKAAERDIARQILEYKEKDDKGKLFNTVAEEWEQQHYKHTAYTTATRYKVHVKHATGYFDGYYIKAITPKDVEQFLESFVIKDYTTKSIRDTLSVLRMIFSFAYINDYIHADPTLHISAPRGKDSFTRTALSDEEIEIVKNSIGCTFGLLAYFLLYTGLRKGEALALQYKDIDFDNKKIYVSKSMYHEGNNPKLKDTKTKNGNRTVILLDKLAEKLPHGKPNQYVFADNGNMIKKSVFHRNWTKYCAETGLRITAHQLRHTYATILFEADIDVKTAQFLMGHSDITTTRNIYTHVRERQINKTAEQLNNYLTNI